MPASQTPQTYTFNARPFSSGQVFTLRPDGLSIAQGPRERLLAFREMSEIRLHYTPQNFNSGACTATIASGWRRVAISSVSWRGLTQQVSDNQGYTNFVRALVSQAARANPAVRLVAGMGRLRFWLMLPASIGIGAFLGWFLLRAVAAGYWLAALMVAALIAYFLWWTSGFLNRNRPGIFTPDTLPPAVMPDLPDHQG